MLFVQNYLWDNGLKRLQEEFHIRVTEHPELKLIILNYDQIRSKPRDHPTVCECRQLVLENDSAFGLVGKSFNRFFNYGEFRDTLEFNWNNFRAEEKEDGSLIMAFCYLGDWHWITRGSFAFDECGKSGCSWRELLCKLLPLEKIAEVGNEYTSYVFEFCSIWNKNVTHYKNSKLVLLSEFYYGHEEKKENVDRTAELLGVTRPKIYEFKDIDSVIEYVKSQKDSNPTWEGVVLVDDNFNRIKVKNEGYLILAKLANNGQGFTPKGLMPVILGGETTQTFLHIKEHYPEVLPLFYELSKKVEEGLKDLTRVWKDAQHIENQKEFAQYILPRTPFASILFKARKMNQEPEDLWSSYEELILKNIS